MFVTDDITFPSTVMTVSVVQEKGDTCTDWFLLNRPGLLLIRPTASDSRETVPVTVFQNALSVAVSSAINSASIIVVNVFLAGAIIRNIHNLLCGSIHAI